MFSSAIQRLNDRRDAEGEVGEDAGFTLIELMVVLLILAILLAIAIPTFLGVTKSANDRAAQSNLNTALLNAKAQYQNNSQTYPTTANLVTALTSAPSRPQLPGRQPRPTRTRSRCSCRLTRNALVMTAYSKATSNCWIVVDTPVATAVATPFAAAQTPTVAVDTTLAVAGASAINFSTSQLGPTYAEIKTTTAGTL